MQHENEMWSVYARAICLLQTRNENERQNKIAIHLLQMATLKNHRAAMNALGECLDSGLVGIAPNHPLALQLFKKAAELGDCTAMNNMGCRYRFLTRDWFQNAAANGSTRALLNLGINYLEDSSRENKNDYQKIRMFYRQATNKGDFNGYIYLAMLTCSSFECHLSTQKRHARIFQYYQLAANHNIPKAQYLLGTCFEAGIGVKMNYKRAFQLYRQAAFARPSSRESHVHMATLAMCYENGKGCNLNKKEAARWYALALANVLNNSYYRRDYTDEIERCNFGECPQG